MDRNTGSDLYAKPINHSVQRQYNADTGEDENHAADPHQLDPSIETQAVPYVEPVFWCQIEYHEMERRVGDPCKVSQCYLTIDGYTDPCSSDRFCLGSLSNVHRSKSVEATRSRIGKGACLYYLGSKVYVENLTESSVFVQSANCSKIFGCIPTTVWKIPSKCNMVVFDMEFFAKDLDRAVNLGVGEVQKLAQMCTIRMSFVRGWGPDYPIKAITSAPCWIEIHLNGPLQWLDNVLVLMPQEGPGSSGGLTRTGV